jgi:hypothetical protein
MMPKLMGNASLGISRDYIALQQNTYPKAGAALLIVPSNAEDSVPVFCVHDAVTGGITSRTQGIGLNGPVTRELIDHVESFFLENGATPRVTINPMAHESTFEQLHARGYARVGYTTWLLQQRDGALPSEVPSPSDYRIEMARPEEIKDLSYVISSAFSPRGMIPPPPELFSLHLLLMKMPNARFYKVVYRGNIVGGAGWVYRNGVANLLGCAILQEHRRKGLQQALISRRMRDVFEHGARYIILGSVPGGPSQRNAERLGFRAMFTDTQMEQPSRLPPLKRAG